MAVTIRLLHALRGNWAAVVLITVLIAAVVVTTLYAPPEIQTALFGGEGIIATAIGIWLRSPKDRASLPPPPS